MKKLLVIILIFLLCINIFIVSSYANFDFEYNGNSYNIPDLPVDDNGHYILFCNGIYCFYITSSEVITCKPYSSNSGQYYLKLVNGNIYFLDLSEKTWEKRWGNEIGYHGYELTYVKYFIFSSESIFDESGNIIFEAQSKFNAPSILNSQEELESGKFDYLKISSGNFNTSDNQSFYLFSYYYSDDIDDIDSIYPRKEILLDGPSNKYFVGSTSSIYRYNIPFGELGIDLKEGNKYGFKLVSKDSNGNVKDYWQSITFSIGELTDAEKLQNQQDITNGKLDEQTDAIKNQTEAMKEQTETNKNIFEKIGDILSYINPFSENFFVYKLIELLVNAIKSLFIPSDGFFNNYFTELKDWFSDRLGFLFYPFELVIDILNKILNINFNEPVFNIPDISEPFTGKKIISATNFNLNSLLENNILNTVHEVYLVCLDAFIIFELVNLFRRKYEEVTTK